MNRLLPLLLVLACATATFAQHGKPAPAFQNGQSPNTPKLSWPGKNAAPPAENPFNLNTNTPQPMPAMAQRSAGDPNIRVTYGENGLPIMIEGKTAASGTASDNVAPANRAIAYVASLAPMGIVAPAEEFQVSTVQTDEQGNNHVRMDQMFQGLPVWGGEVIAHTKNGSFERINGRYFPTPKMASVVPALAAEQAITKAKTAFGIEKVKTNWSAEELKLIGGQQFKSQLLVFHPNGDANNARLAWHIVAFPNVLTRMVYFVDANSGEILDSYNNTCNFTGHADLESHPAHVDATCDQTEITVSGGTLVDGPVTISGQDLFSINRSFTNGGWQSGSQVLMEDASKSMFNSGASNMPSDPIGAIATLDGLNTSPETQSFNYDVVTSSSTTFTNKKAAISAHLNAGLSYDYYKSKFNRNSIDGVGGNILSFVNITESDGSSMENAFWNGEAMWYGNGGSTFKPLARGLDVGGHEMTHGVVEKTANLVYQGESGALNESFADVFGSLIDSDDWTIGEDVMQTGGGLPAALRSLSNPHNGFTVNSPWWQPNHVNEKYTGTQDNGGVHINSGIPNYAYYLFASNAAVGKVKAEQVYYKALRDYLTKSSKFVDCRIAVIQAATDLYGAATANIAADAFAAVGIGGSAPSGNYLGQLNPNPGTDFVLCVSNNLQNLDLASGTGTILKTIYNQGVQSRVSVTDNGLDMVFINAEGHIVGISLNYTSNPIGVTTSILSDQPEWRSTAISKDGRFVAGLTTTQEPIIYIFDLATGDSKAYTLYNPTYSQGQVTGDVQYADVLDFDYSGKNLMYDSYNQLTNSQGDDIGYWDIGFLEFWKNNQFTSTSNAFISKLFSGLPERVGIGNPTFSKNSPYVLAFDLIDETTTTTRYDVYGANSETGDYDVLVANNGTLGWPNYNRLDTKILYETQPSSGVYNIRLQGLNANKIQPSGSSTAFISNHSWGVWYGNGTRSLHVAANEPTAAPLTVNVAPNPTRDVTQISLNVQSATAAQVSISNMFGQVLMTSQYNLSSGENLLDVDLHTLPSGAYVVKIAAGDAAAAVKVVKE